MLTKLKINKENPYWYRIKVKTDELTFDFTEDINVIIGRNGVGKSSVVKMIQEAWLNNNDNAKKGLEFESKKVNDKENIFVFTAEENNPKQKLADISPFDNDYSMKVAYWFERSEMSSGMQTKEQFVDAMTLAEQARLIIFDEPEQALDAESLLIIKKEMKKRCKDTQFIVISHHPAFILDPDFNIIEFDKKKPYKPSVEKLVKSFMSV